MLRRAPGAERSDDTRESGESVTGVHSITRASAGCEPAEMDTARKDASSAGEKPSAFQTAKASPRATSRIARSDRVTHAARNAFRASTWFVAASIVRISARKEERSAAPAGAGGGGGGGSGIDPGGKSARRGKRGGDRE